MIYYSYLLNCYLDKVETAGLTCSSIPIGCGAGISGPDETKVQYEEVRNKHVCIYLYNVDDR